MAQIVPRPSTMAQARMLVSSGTKQEGEQPQQAQPVADQAGPHEQRRDDHRNGRGQPGSEVADPLARPPLSGEYGYRSAESVVMPRRYPTAISAAWVSGPIRHEQQVFRRPGAGAT